MGGYCLFYPNGHSAKNAEYSDAMTTLCNTTTTTTAGTVCGNYGARSNVCFRNRDNPIEPAQWHQLSETRCKANCVAQNKVRDRVRVRVRVRKTN